VSDLPDAIEERVHHMLPRDLLHDLRTPLAHILGYSELMIEQMQARGEEEFIPYLEKIRGAGHKLLEMMTQNFQESRPRENARSPEPTNPTDDSLS
jgi:signal transduction histidine kinase